MVDNLMRVTDPEGGGRTQESRACRLLCIHATPCPRTVAAWAGTPKLPRGSVSLQQHQSLSGHLQSTQLPTCLLRSLRHSGHTHLVAFPCCAPPTACIPQWRLPGCRWLQPCPLLKPAPAILHRYPQLGLPKFPGHVPGSAVGL